MNLVMTTLNPFKPDELRMAPTDAGRRGQLATEGTADPIVEVIGRIGDDATRPHPRTGQTI